MCEWLCFLYLVRKAGPLMMNGRPSVSLQKRRDSEIAMLTMWIGLRNFGDNRQVLIDRARPLHCGCTRICDLGRELPWSKMILAEVFGDRQQRTMRNPRHRRGNVCPRPRPLSCWAALRIGSSSTASAGPSAGVHPGATVALTGLLLSRRPTGAPDEEMLFAIVAACDVMFRIGLAMRHTPEQAGFHAPGPHRVRFGSAIRRPGGWMGLSRRQLANALGIARIADRRPCWPCKGGAKAAWSQTTFISGASGPKRGFFWRRDWLCTGIRGAARALIEGEFGLLGRLLFPNSDPSKLLTELGEPI